MLECALDQIGDHKCPPTPDEIERLRQEQLAAIKDFRRLLLDVQTSGKSAA